MPAIRALVAMLVIALALVACDGAIGPGTPSPDQGDTPAVEPTPDDSPELTPDASPDQSPTASPGESPALNQAFVILEQRAGSNISGGAILTDLGENETAVTIGVVAVGFEDPLPAGIYTGDCDGVTADPTYDLVDVEVGASNTVLPVSLDQLVDGQHVLALRRSAADSTVVACAPITRTPTPS